MVLTDRFGLTLTTDSVEAADRYVAGIDLLLSANIGAGEQLQCAIAADPEFALAHIARARLLQLRARIPEAKEAAALAQSLCEGVTARERGHIEAIALAVAGAAPAALAIVRTYAAEYPRDALPLSLALGVFGLLGFSGRRDHHEAQLALLEALAPHWGDDWWFLGYLGWAYIETGDVATGTRLVERSLAANPRNAHAAHQRAHGFFEAGDAAGGAAFVEHWLDGYDRASHLHCHLSWHLALFELARGNAERARVIYLDSITPSVAQAVPMLVLADSASFLWRWRIYGATPSLDQDCRGRRPCAATIPARQPRLCRSPHRPLRSRNRRRGMAASPHRRTAEARPRRLPAAGHGSTRALRRRGGARPRRPCRSCATPSGGNGRPAPDRR
jgi:tetratricopeptide (TPR) repeat protein